MSRWKIEPNPYVELDLDQLAEEGRGLRAKPAAPGPHSEDSRKQLACDLDRFMATAINRLSPGHYTPSEPETELMMGAQTTVAAPFGGMYRAKACRLRNQAMERAGMPGEKFGKRAWNREDGLMEELRKLDKVQPRRKGSPPISRTLTRRPIEALRSVHVKAKEVQH